MLILHVRQLSLSPDLMIAATTAKNFQCFLRRFDRTSPFEDLEFTDGERNIPVNLGRSCR